MTTEALDDLDADLRDALVAVAGLPTLLVACDVDGTLAPIVDRPSDAAIHPGALTTLSALAGLAGTPVALVSGRPLDDLRAMTLLGPDVVLVGSHGAEHGDQPVLSPSRALALDQVLRDVRAITDGVPGVLLEEKAAGVAVHVRLADRDDAARVTSDVLDGPGARAGVRTTQGKEVVELSVLDTDKGQALARLRAETGADAVVFAGDDVTDEWAFAQLTHDDVSIKVGPGATGARFRVRTTDDVPPLLHLLLEARRSSIESGW